MSFELLHDMLNIKFNTALQAGMHPFNIIPETFKQNLVLSQIPSSYS